MTSAAATASLPTRSEIEGWSTSHLSDAATSWRSAATASEGAFDEHRQNISSPGGTTWEGDAKDAALDRVTKDVAVVGRQGDVLREAADLAENGAQDIKAAKDKAVEAITAAENDGFSVGEDLSVTDTREYDINTIAERNRALAEHAEDIRWAAEQLMQADKLVGDRLQAKSADLEGIRFEDEGDGRDAEPTVQLVDNKVQDKPGEDRKDEPGDKPAEQATGQIGPFAVPKSIEDAAKKSGLKPDEKPPAPDDGGLGDLLGANDHPEDKPAEGKPGDEKHPGLPPALSQLPPAPDKATIDRQAAKVEAARQTLAAAEAKQKAAAGQGYVQGAGSGPSPEEFKSLTQEVFDARRELTEQTNALRELSAASAANGGPTVPVPALPPDADKQAFPPPPSISDRLADANHQLSENTFGLIPDVAKTIDTFNNWGTASTEDKAQAILESAGMLPLPFGKPLAEGLEHGIDIFSGGARHLDDLPTHHVDAPSGGHAPVDAPAAGHAPVDAPHHSAPDTPVDHNTPPPTVEHHAPDSAPTHQPPEPDVFDPSQGSHYTSGDGHYPGGWPPSTPPETWQPGNTNPGWHYVDRGPDRNWMPYQEQISGAERLPDGRIPEYVRTDPQTGNPVHFDGHDLRGTQEVFLDAKDGYAKLATEPGKPWTQGMERTIVDEIPRQLRAMPPGATLEVHVSDPLGAAAIRNVVEANDWFEVSVIYTPKAP
ncbi:Tox-REase-5 domain-containing protein [Mycolicibacterium houstonense]|uniref:Tox-REase-5 domain-containing protein n=1 Tax=Mycolicibacterium houstonense TaxID=146021 RepID=UPI00093A55A0|nr:Tox-REase-5 domain-containing protein [Mycolicibacterium houstonense]